MKKLGTALIFGGLVATVVAGNADAREIGFGDIEVGVTTCGEAIALADRSGDIIDAFTSAITDAPGLKLGPNAFGFDFVQSGTVLCGPDEKVAGIFLVIPKHRVTEIADALAAKYIQKSWNLPRLGSGSAKYELSSKMTTAEVTYVHVSFEAEVLIQTRELDKMIVEYNKKKKEKEAARTKSAF